MLLLFPRLLPGLLACAALGAPGRADAGAGSGAPSATVGGGAEGDAGAGGPGTSGPDGADAAFAAAAGAPYPREALAERVEGVVVVVAPAGAATTVRSGVRLDLDADARAVARARAEARGVLASELVVAYTLAVSEPLDAATAALRVTVRGPDGAPLPGARVRVEPAAAAGPAAADDRAAARARITDRRGRARLFLPPGAAWVHVEAPGLAPATARLTLEPGRALSVTLVATPLATVTRVGVAAPWPAPPRAPAAPMRAPTTDRTYTRRDLLAVPGAGEDALRALVSGPGVSVDTAGPATFSVRGADPDSLLVLYDGVPLPGARPVAGLAGLVDPDLIAAVTLTPSAPDAAVPATAGGALALDGWGDDDRDGRARDVDGAASVSFREARLAVTAPVPGAPGLTVALSARRAYSELYAWGLDIAGALDAPRALPDHDALTARLAWTRGPSRLRLSWLRTTGVLDAPARAERLVPRSGTFTETDALHLLTVDYRLDRPVFELRSLASVARAETTLGAESGAGDRTTDQLFLRADARVPAWDAHAMRFGVLGRFVDDRVRLALLDPLGLPTWAAAPQGTSTALVAATDRGWEPTAAAYAEHTWDGFVSSRVGVRATWLPATGEVLPSPTAGVALPLPTGTVPRILGGLYHHVVADPTRRGPVEATDIRAERAWQLVVGVDQALPIGAATVVRVEGHLSELDNLLVWDEDGVRDPLEVPSADGYGRTLGVDLSFTSSLPRLRLDGHLSLLRAERTNPLNSRLPDTYVPGHAEAASGSLSVTWQATPALRLAARYAHRAGRPVSSVEPDGAAAIALAALDDQRLADLRTLDVRIEWRRATTRLGHSAYVDVLNVLNLPDPLLRTASLVDGDVRLGAVEQLPFRPFLGFAVDF